MNRSMTIGFSWSGHERNHLFLSSRATRFDDVSGISGLDHEGDGRVLSLLDFDRDGWQDFAIVNASDPMFQLFRNRIGHLDTASKGDIVAIRLVGGNQSAKASSWSNRDGYGAEVTVMTENQTYVREHRCGEGFAAQNSRTMLVGVGSAKTVSLNIKWPSGRTSTVSDVEAGSLVTVFERKEQTPTENGVQIKPYRKHRTPVPNLLRVAQSKTRLELSLPESAPPARLRVFTTLSPACLTCLRELPEFAVIREKFDAKDVQFYGLPMKPFQSVAQIEQFEAKHQPAYQILKTLTPEDRQRINAATRSELKQVGTPATFITDERGIILHAKWGAPTASELTELLAR